MPISNKIRYINKRFTNRITEKIAGKAHSPIALVKHTGRHSGKLYTTPIMVQRSRNGFVFALTYGAKVDWYLNILAAGNCMLTWQGNIYQLNQPQGLSPTDGRNAFPYPQRLILKWLAINDFFEMQIMK
jgi:deazaflavin-dependent oxidoreductase (nitroreductase family)